ncbi:OST-HTH/LOTUS domain-containing protein [Ralstonia pseudosolanacearum]|uniref:OST-HTH/LOTUS domain-containing protein n=1 Tax=Ralstonia pseudosolanacearum TaxID=1310165 RepID=UPI0040546905
MTDPTIAPSQHEVQRLLGRCLLRLQQYEKLVKTLLVHHELSGPVEDLERNRDARVRERSTNTLGQSIGELMASYVVSTGSPEPDLDEHRVMFVRMRTTLTLSVEDHARTQTALKELVDLRNDLVHQFIDRYDLWSDEGCVAASAYLRDSYVRIDRHFAELRAWIDNMTKAHTLMAAFAQSSTFHDLIVNGIAPDGTFDWADAGIRRVLQEAASALAIDGWTRLDQAIAWIEAHHPDQLPAKYGCRTWPQVLHESRHFELQYRLDDAGHRIAWFRLRMTRAMPLA